MRRYVLFLLLLVQACCYAQAYKYRFRIIDLPEEFKNQYISLVDEDAAGMIWFVTNSGLHRYDGNQVLSFDTESTPALPETDISHLLADSRNHLWVATPGKLVCFNLQQWSTQIIPFQHPPVALQNYGVNALAEGKDGTVYVGCGNKLFRVTHDSLQLIDSIDRQAANPDNLNITGIHEPVAGHLLLTTSGGSIVAIQHRQSAFERPVAVQFLPPASDTPGAGTTNKYLLNLPGKGPYLVDVAQRLATPLVKISPLQNLENFDISIAESGGMQAVSFYTNKEANETGLGIYNARQNTFEDLSRVYPIALRGNKMRAIGYKSGHILVPYKGGIATISTTASAFDVFAASLENTNSIRTIFKEPGDNLLIGSYLYSFIQFNETTGTSSYRSGNVISCLIPWSKDTLLAGSEGGGLSWYLPNSNRFISLTSNNANALIDPIVTCVNRESDTSFWVGANSGFYLFNPYTHRLLLSSSQETGHPLWHSIVYDILKTGTTVFFATRKGLYKYNRLRKSLTQLLTTPADNYADAYFSCLRLVNNQVWAGTVGNGMVVLDTAGRFLRKMTTANGLAGNVIFSNPLCNNHLLVGTRTGLSIINLASGKINNYSSEYYLPANEFNRSAWCVNGDTVYMGTINGFIRISMKQLLQRQATISPSIRFSSFTFSNGSNTQSDYTLPYTQQPSLIIAPGVSTFSIGFGGISELADGLKLYYRLSTNGPWQEIGQRREITFVNIAPDNYTMQVAARLPDGRWMENLLTLPIEVQPHFYQTWWWKGLLILAALGLIWLGIKYRERNLKKEQQLRSRIADDLHDEVGSALTRIYYQAGMSIAADGKATVPPATVLQQIVSSSQEALSSMSDMVWSIDAHHDNAPDMVARMRDYLDRLQDELNCHFDFSVSGSYEHLRISQVVRQNILLVFKEAINNAIKYGKDKTATVHLLLSETELQLQVTNPFPAIGKVEDTKQGGHGMRSMQLRADKIKARLTIHRTAESFSVALQAKPF